MSLREKVQKITAAVPELASRQKIDLDPPAAPEPLRSGWETPAEEENPARVAFYRALSRSSYVSGPTVEELREQQYRDNAVAQAWMSQRAGQ